ncbi:MAG: hypothetical protein IT522_02460 [Burkholderiales bacterium]|nr:hypothetical protein [Burkholderiales bacterium]
MGKVASKSRSLFSPIFRSRKYIWVKVMDSDGILLSERKVHSGEGGDPAAEVSLLLGVILQSEESTSQTKPNPVGKASLAHVPNGIWIDVVNGGRRRLDRLLVIFVLPKGAAMKHQRAFATAKRNVENAADMMPEAVTIAIPRGASSSKIEAALKKTARPFLIGAGRPKGAA